MGANLRLPNITGLSEKEQILQIKNYLFQLVGDLQFELNNLGTASSNTVEQTPQDNTSRYAPVASIQSTFYSLKPLIMRSTDIIDAYYDAISKKITAGYVAETDFTAYKKETDKVIADFLLFLLECTDYVIEHGTSDGWTYKKWKNGTYEMYGLFEVTATASDINGTLYRTNDIEVATPFSINDDAVVTGTVAGNCWLTNGAYAHENAVSIRIMSDETISLTEPVTVRLHVAGTYSQTTEETENVS